MPQQEIYNNKSDICGSINSRAATVLGSRDGLVSLLARSTGPCSAGHLPRRPPRREGLDCDLEQFAVDLRAADGRIKRSRVALGRFGRRLLELTAALCDHVFRSRCGTSFRCAPGREKDLSRGHHAACRETAYAF